MTDLERTEELFKSIGIKYAEEVNKSGKIRLILTAEMDESVDGNYGSTASFWFDKDGKFEVVAIWDY